MTYRLRRDYQFTDEKTGKVHRGTSYHVNADWFVMGHSDPAQAKTFPTAKEATAYARKHGLDKGYKPEAVV